MEKNKGKAFPDLFSILKRLYEFIPRKLYSSFRAEDYSSGSFIGFWNGILYHNKQRAGDKFYQEIEV